ncbi:MAG: apolipoprotein N-acyltransferase [Paucibacter sp.]|nr:apolipoprotein N-acyltransferase [Roseateles sp.]
MRYLLALAAGALQAASFAPTDAWWLQILTLAALAALSAGQRPLHAALQGWSFGVGWMAAGLWWLYISMHDFGGLPAPFAVGAVLLLSLFLGSYYAVGVGVAAWLAPEGPWRVPVFAGAWLLAELARATFFTGFPWIASGYAHTVGPLAGWAPWIGVYGISLLAAACAAALASLDLRAMAATAVLATLSLVLPQEFTESSGSIDVSVVQPNVPQDQKFNAELMDGNLESLTRQIESAKGQLVVTPESVVPLPLDFLPKGALARMELAARNHPVLLGIFLGNERSGYVNSQIALGTMPRYEYGKRHLLPFGEFVPTGFHWFVRLLGIPMEDQVTGRTQAPLFVAGQHLRPLICYEDLFGEDFVRSALPGEDAATGFINLSNLAWFGTTMVLDQHLQFSQMRALEFQRPFVRSTNTGATAVVDHHGRVTARLPAATRGVLEARVEGRRGSTPYARWLGALGLWPLWGLALLPLVLKGLAWRRWSAS